MRPYLLQNIRYKLAVIGFFGCMVLVWNLRTSSVHYDAKYSKHNADAHDSILDRIINKCSFIKTVFSKPNPEEETTDTWFVHHKDRMSQDPILRRYLPRISTNDHVMMMLTLDTFSRLCNQNNLTYFLWGGSLLGAYRHHGFIPWDDDLDIILIVSDINKTRKALTSHPKFKLYAPKDYQWKFFSKDLPQLHGMYFKYPFIDIFLFNENSTHIFGRMSNIKRYVYKKTDIFPIHLRPFQGRRVATPCNIYRFTVTYNANKCESLYWMHKENVGLSFSTIPCVQLHDIYPFVFREKTSPSGFAFEVLKRGDHVLANISVPQTCSAVATLTTITSSTVSLGHTTTAKLIRKHHNQP